MNKIKPLSLLFSLSLLIYSCKDNSQYENLSPKDQEISSKIEGLFDNKLIIVNEDTVMIDETLESYYEKRSYVPLWFKEGQLTEHAHEVIHMLVQSTDYALPTEFYHTASVSVLAEQNDPKVEVLLTCALSTFMEHHHFGILNDDKSNKKPFSFYQGFAPNLENIANNGIGWDMLSSQWGGEKVDELLEKWAKYPFHGYLNSDSLSPLPNFRKDSLKAYRLAFENLTKMGFITDTITSDSSRVKALQDYQELYALKPDGLIGKYSQHILTRNHQSRFRQLVLAVEKWKWKKDTLKGSFIYVNIPEYHLYYYRNDSLKAVHRVIVGSTETPTPEFTADMTTLVTYPYWHVPHSIASTQIVALARRNPQKVSDKGYIIEDLSKNTVSPDSLDWKKYNKNYFPFRIKQDKGTTNSLGILKFLFPNKHMVYIHDTPGKYLFINDVRAFSHGCIRLQDPIDFATLLIEDQELKDFNGDTLKARLDSSFQRVIELKKKRTVFIDYITVSVHPLKESLRFHLDIYGRDEKYLKVIFDDLN